MARLRCTFDITDDQDRFLSSLPHGYRQQIYAALTDMLIDMTKRCGGQAIGAIIAQKIKLEEYFNE